ncbi:MAG TPA: lysophospholipid acyltransferase family protein [Planctomycetota bacterium]|nr:lysophospholipid acyltransferase family protein [Planctomycetota bacterium]
MARSRRLEWFLAEWVGSWLWGVVYRSLRLEVHGDEHLEELEKQYGAIAFASWHYEMLPTLYHHRHCDGGTFTGEHADAELVARAVRRIGYTPVRGSTTRGGVRGLIELIFMMRRGHGVGFTPDGPRGPRCIAQVGIAILGQRSGCPVVPMGFASQWFWQFRSWDRMRIPKPFSEAVICYGDAILVPTKLTPEELEGWRKRIEDGITAASRKAEELLGLPPERSAFAE